QEGERLAAPSLGSGEHVFALKRMRKRLLLDRCGRDKVVLSEPLLQRSGEVEISEFHFLCFVFSFTRVSGRRALRPRAQCARAVMEKRGPIAALNFAERQ